MMSACVRASAYVLCQLYLWLGEKEKGKKKEYARRVDPLSCGDCR